MSALDLLRFAATALLRNRRRTSLCLLGVMIGVAAVVVLTSLGEGARRYVTEQFSSLGTNLLIVSPGRNETTGFFPGVTGAPNDLTLRDVEALQRGVRSALYVVPMVVGSANVSHGERRRQAGVFGSTDALREARELRLGSGSFLPAGDVERGAPVAVLGATLASELFPDRSAVGGVIRIADWRMRVIGVLERTGSQLGADMDETVLMPVASAMRLFDRSSLFRVLIKVRAHSDLDSAREATLRILAERHDEEDVTVITQDSVVASLNKILTVLTLGVAGIGAISLAVAGLGVMNVMLVSVAERTQEVGLLKAIGAERRQVLAIFLAEAVLVAIAGALLGLLVGFAAVRIFVVVYPAFPAAPPLWAVISVFCVAVGVGAVFGVLPARRATALDPVSALAGR